MPPRKPSFALTLLWALTAVYVSRAAGCSLRAVNLGLEMGVKKVKAVLVTDEGRQSAVLSVDKASNDGLAVLAVNGVPRAPEDLPEGAYLEVNSSEMADQAALAGFFTHPRSSSRRRWNRIEGKFLGAMLLAGAVGSLLWAVRSALALDLPGVLGWVGLSLFAGLLGRFWWFYGEDEISRRDAQAQLRARRWRRWFGSFGRGR